MGRAQRVPRGEARIAWDLLRSSHPTFCSQSSALPMHQYSTRIAVTLLGLAIAQTVAAADPVLSITTPMPPPAWALLERELLRANAAACREFFDRYFDDRGCLLCVERWGGDDGPDDAIENCNDWPHPARPGRRRRGPRACTRRPGKGTCGSTRWPRRPRCRSPATACTTRNSRSCSTGCTTAKGSTVFNLQGLSDPRRRALSAAACAASPAST